MSRETLVIENLSASVLAGVQPALLGKQGELTTDGLLQRFCLVAMSETTFREDKMADTADYNALIGRLIGLDRVELALTDDAVEAMEDLHKMLFAFTKMFDGALASFVGKLDGVAGTLCLILHLASEAPCFVHGGDGFASSKCVTAETVEKVTKIILDFVVPNGVEFYLLSSHSPDWELLLATAGYILTSGKDRIRASDLTSNVRGLRGLELVDLNRKVSTLVGAGWLIPEGDRQPYCRAWTVHPKVRAQLAARRLEVEERNRTITAMLRNLRQPQD
jgi:hypothetical protein